MQNTSIKKISRKWWITLLSISSFLLFVANIKSPNDHTNRITDNINTILKESGIQPSDAESLPIVTGTQQSGVTIITITEYKKIPEPLLIKIIDTIKQQKERGDQQKTIKIQLFQITRKDLDDFHREHSIIEEINPSITISINKDGK